MPVATKIPEPAHDLVAANGPDAVALAADLEHARQIIHDLRNPVGAVRLAVQMLAGPLRGGLDKLPEAERKRVESVLEALETSTQQLCHLVGHGSTRRRRPDPPVEPSTAQEPAVRAAVNTDGVELGPLLRRLEILTVTRSSLPALVAVDAAPELRCDVHGPELLRALSNLVENAIEASARATPGQGPWTVDVRAYSEPAEVLGDAMEIVIEIRDQGEGFPAAVLKWLREPLRDGATPPSHKTDGGEHGVGLRVARRVAEEAGGRLEVVRAPQSTCVRLRVPQR